MLPQRAGGPFASRRNVRPGSVELPLRLAWAQQGHMASTPGAVKSDLFRRDVGARERRHRGFQLRGHRGSRAISRPRLSAVFGSSALTA
jgi:hypothetical protein